MNFTTDYIANMGENLKWAGKNFGALHEAASNGCPLAMDVLELKDMTLRRSRPSDQEKFNQACDNCKEAHPEMA